MALSQAVTIEGGAHLTLPDADQFRPAGILRNRHLQSVMASLRVRSAAVRRRAAPMLDASTEMILDCGRGVRLMGAHAAIPGGDRPLVVLIHGWEGSSDSLYLMSLAARLFDGGCDVFRLNLRDHGGTQHLNRELFHSCRLSDVTGALAAIARHFPGRRVMLVGFSLGGNFALRVACSAPAEGIVVDRVLAVSPVLDPHRTLDELDRGLPLYRYYFMRKWRRSLLRKAACFPDDYDFSRLDEFKTLASMTAYFVEKYTGFPSLDDYLRGYALVGDRLGRLAVPSVVVAAEDDPIIPGQDLDELAHCPALHVVRVRHGGHCGFFDSWGFSRWLEASALRLFNPSAEVCAGRRAGG